MELGSEVVIASENRNIILWSLWELLYKVPACIYIIYTSTIIIICLHWCHSLCLSGKFEVVFLSSAIGHEQTVLVIMLKCFSRINRYLAVSKRGKVKIVKVQ